MEVAGDMFGLLSDRPEAAQLMAWLVGADAQRIWVQEGAALSGNLGVSTYPDVVTRGKQSCLRVPPTSVSTRPTRWMPHWRAAFLAAVMQVTADPSRLDAVLDRMDQIRTSPGRARHELFVLARATTCAPSGGTCLGPVPSPWACGCSSSWSMPSHSRCGSVEACRTARLVHARAGGAAGHRAVLVPVHDPWRVPGQPDPAQPGAMAAAAGGHRLAPVLAVTIGVWDSLGVLRPTPAMTLEGAWLASTFVAPIGVGSLSAVLYLFPDGHFVSRRWRWALLVPIAGTLLLSLGSALDRTMIWYPILPMPTGLPGWAASIAMPARFAGVAALAVATILAAASVTLRYRHGDAELRRQLRWIVLDGAILALTLPPVPAWSLPAPSRRVTGEVLLVLAILGAATFPVVVAIAITRADLFDIDIIIGRTLVYVPLTAILAGIYAASVALLQRVFVLLTGEDSDAVVLLSTLLLAASFTPVKGALDALVERHFRTPVPLAPRTAARTRRLARVIPSDGRHPTNARHAAAGSARGRIKQLEAALAQASVTPPPAAQGRQASSSRDGRQPDQRKPRARRQGNTSRHDQATPPLVADPRSGSARRQGGSGYGSGTREEPGRVRGLALQDLALPPVGRVG